MNMDTTCISCLFTLQINQKQSSYVLAFLETNQFQGHLHHACDKLHVHRSDLQCYREVSAYHICTITHDLHLSVIQITRGLILEPYSFFVFGFYAFKNDAQFTDFAAYIVHIFLEDLYLPPVRIAEEWKRNG